MIQSVTYIVHDSIPKVDDAVLDSHEHFNKHAS